MEAADTGPEGQGDERGASRGQGHGQAHGQDAGQARGAAAAPPPRPEHAPTPAPGTGEDEGTAGGGGGLRAALVGAAVVLLALGVGLGVGADDGGWPPAQAYAGYDGHGLGDGDGFHGGGAYRDGDGFHGGDAGTVVLDGVSGRVRVTADPDAHEVTGSFHRADGRPGYIRAGDGDDGDDADGDGRSGAAGPDGTLTVACADENGAPQACDGDLVLVVPEHTGLRLRQTSGEADVDGLGGDHVSLTGASLRLTTHGLHPAHADVTVTSGSADLGFAAAPGDLDLHATSASVAVRLPQVDGGYAVSTNATSADVRVQIPRDAAASHHVALTVTSGSLALQNAQDA